METQITTTTTAEGSQAPPVRSHLAGSQRVKAAQEMGLEGRAKPVTFNHLVPIEGQDSTQQTLDHYTEQSEKASSVSTFVFFNVFLVFLVN